MHPATARTIEILGLTPHPEGGHYREVFRAPQPVATAQQGVRSASTAIYFLLAAGDFSVWHRVRSDEVWHHYEGAPVDLWLLSDSGEVSQIRLGSALEQGERPLAVVPAGVWQAARCAGDPHALCGCTVAPGFEFSDFELGSRPELLALFPQHDALIKALTRP